MAEGYWRHADAFCQRQWRFIPRNPRLVAFQLNPPAAILSMPVMKSILLSFTGLVFAGTSAAQSALPVEKVLPLQLAAEAAATAVDACRRDGYPVSAAVVDRAGIVRALLRGDGAGPHTADGSARKAYTAATFRMPTTYLAEFVNNTPSAAGLHHADRVLVFGGGLPIEAGDEVVGAIAVGGAPGGKLDDACAKAGLNKIKDRLK